MPSSKIALPEGFSELLQSAGKHSKGTLQPLKGGANNRVYLLDHGQEKFVLKAYFHNPSDTRQRLKHEYSFLSYAWQLGIRNIPQPVAKHEEKHLGLYGFLPGKPAAAPDVTTHAVQEAIHFFLRLNADKSTGNHLPTSSEACFSYSDYFTTIEKKLSRLENIPLTDALEHEVRNFLDSVLIPKWKKMQASITKKIHDHASLQLTSEERCISPSDFGFHNALVAEKDIYFIDFEYAGWDDPAKTICDFFLQPKVPVPMTYFTEFSEKVAQAAAFPEKCLSRLKLVFPVCQMKWCLIMLNLFSQTGKMRRNFSDAEEMQQKEAQLLKVKNFFQTIQA